MKFFCESIQFIVQISQLFHRPRLPRQNKPILIVGSHSHWL